MLNFAFSCVLRPFFSDPALLKGGAIVSFTKCIQRTTTRITYFSLQNNVYTKPRETVRRMYIVKKKYKNEK